MGYRGKQAEQAPARELRGLGWTYAEICAELDVARSSVSLWVRDVEFEPRPRAKARKRGPNKLERAKHEEIETMLAEGRERIGRLSDRDLLIAGAALYAGEGSKTDGRVTFANSDPRIISRFLCWLRRFFDVDEPRLRLRLRPYLHEGLDLELANEFWSQLTSIPLTQFGRPYRAVPDPSIRTSKHPLGCPSVVYACSRTHRAVMGLVGALLSCDVHNPG